MKVIVMSYKFVIGRKTSVLSLLHHFAKEITDGLFIHKMKVGALAASQHVKCE